MIDIKWDRQYEVGHKRIDFEHQIFVDLIKTVSQVTDQDQEGSRERTIRLMQEVKKYAEFHFFSEENIMQDVKYPELEEHKQEHRILLAALDDRIHQYRSKKITRDDFCGFLFQWFAFHTIQKDLPIVKYMHNPAAE